ncbi:MAG: hypothetical protein EPO20_17500 [Betaproteobacteria bacterium]|nr:MAG: hypothetical protein EPO20_17500 [Betaproteobacteria bacterium]
MRSSFWRSDCTGLAQFVPSVNHAARSARASLRRGEISGFALRGHCSIQGSTDIPTLYNLHQPTHIARALLLAPYLGEPEWIREVTDEPATALPPFCSRQCLVRAAFTQGPRSYGCRRP